MYLTSQSNNDGSYTLDVVFELGTDVNVAQVLVQNRVSSRWRCRTRQRTGCPTASASTWKDLTGSGDTADHGFPVVLMLGGFQLLMLGIFGEYLWRTFDEARGRPRYVIEEYLPPSEMPANRSETGPTGQTIGKSVSNPS
jgi:hypothetical protein